MPKAWEIDDFLTERGGELRIDGARAAELAERYGTPLFVFSESRIKHNIARLRRAETALDCRLKICYAAKANSLMGILRAVKESGCDLEVNSGGELWKALEIGFRGEQIIFNGTSKEIWELEMAIDASIYAIQVDSLYELSLIEETARRLKKRANVSLRLVPEIETKTHSGLQTALLTSKFGMMPDEARRAFREHKDNEFLNLCGVHLHIGSQNPESAPYSDALRALFENLETIYRETGIRLEHLNLGGGFPVNYLRDNSHDTDFPQEKRAMFAADYEPADAIETAWRAVKEAARESDAAELLENLTLLIEPGRSVIADAGICLTTVRNVKERPGRWTALGGRWAEEEQSVAGVQRSEKEWSVAGGQLSENDGAGRQSTNTDRRPPITDHSSTDHRTPTTDHSSTATDHWLLTDAGFNLLLSMETYKWYYHLIHAARTDEKHAFPYKLAGPLCDGGDVYFDIEGEGRLPDYRLLPENVRPGEILALLNCGAYSVAQMFQYNGRFLPTVVLTKSDGAVELIRRRDEFKDLVANDLW